MYGAPLLWIHAGAHLWSLFATAVIEVKSGAMFKYLYGPVPITLVQVGGALGSRMTMLASVSVMKVRLGAFSVNWTAVLPIALIDVIPATWALRGDFVAGFAARWKVYLTA